MPLRIGLIALLHLTGRSTQPVISTEEALNGMGLIWAFGADTGARHLTGIDPADTPRGLQVNFHAFPRPPPA